MGTTGTDLNNDYLVFFGAGTSSEFGVYGMRQMTREFYKRFPNHRTRIARMAEDLRRVGFKTNIENFLSYARGQVRPRYALLRSSPFACRFVRCKGLGYDPDASTFVGNIEDFIAAECLVKDYWSATIKKRYASFFKHLQRRFGSSGSPNTKWMDIDIFTTNYDNVIERFTRSYDPIIETFNGFEPKGDDTCAFEPDLYDSRGPIRLYNLHGSLTLAVVVDVKTKEMSFVNSESGFSRGEAFTDQFGRRRKVIERIMIFGYEKDPSREPYFDLLYRLKNKLQKVNLAVVVGYSFSDQSIINVFSDVLRLRTDLKISILDHNAKAIKRSIFSNGRNVRAIPAPFSSFKRI